MKTIEKASLENTKKHYIMAYSDELHKDADLDFKAGVEFAQRWIPVEEDLPKKNTSEFTLFKNSHSSYCFKPDSLEMELKEWIKMNGFTHWRPIEYK